jgi:hypothetical protein
LTCSAFRLASRGFEVLTAHQRDTDTSTNCTQTDDQTAGEGDETEHLFHNSSLDLKEKRKQQTGLQLQTQ